MAGMNRRPKDPNKVALNIRGLSPRTRQEFKVWCAEQGYTMHSAVEILIKMVATGVLKVDLNKFTEI